MTGARHPVDDRGGLAVGLASGLAAGLVGALAMSGFQALLARARITSGVSGEPSTEKAADRASRLVLGRPMAQRERVVAGEGVHYAVGGLVGGLYGVAAEIEPRVTAGRGSAFGAMAATVVDEGLVPAFGLGDPFWNAPLFSHPYSYLSHAVFGTATEAARRLFRRFFARVQAGAAVLAAPGPRAPRPVAPVAPGALSAPRGSLPLAFLLGATAGPRTSAPLTAVTWAARLGWIDLAGSPLAFMGSTKAVAMSTPMALGELVADKLPSTPARTEPVGVIARVASGALSGATVAGGRSPGAAFAGAAGALVATWLGYRLRTQLSKAVGRDWPVAAVEDVIAFGGAALVCIAALAPFDEETDTPDAD